MKLLSEKQYSPPTRKKLIVALLVSSCLLAISHLPQPVQSIIPVLGAIKGVLSVLELTNMVINTWNLYEETGKFLPFGENRDVEILKRMKDLSWQIAQSEQRIIGTMGFTIDGLVKQLLIETSLANQLQELTDLMNRVSYQEGLMRSYLESDEKVESHTLEDFAQNAVSMDSNSILTLLARIELLVTGSRDSSIKNPSVLELLLKSTKVAKSKICGFGLSAQQVIYELYNSISITELKGYSMMQFSWMLLKTYGKGNFTTEAKLMRHRFEARTNRTLSMLQRVMSDASREYWRCDPDRKQHKEGETFVQMTRLLQGYIENEIDLHTDFTCKESCTHYSWGVRQEQCYKGLFCSKQPKCAGKIYSCKFVDDDMWICPAATNSPRRYEYIEFVSLGWVFGQKTQCTRGTSFVESWAYYLFWRCHYCFCLCDDAGPRSDRYINMRESVSDIMNNKVVTGLRFVKKNQIIYLIVQQGKLLPRGQIDNSTLGWVEPEYYSVLSSKLKANVDYNVMNYNNRDMDLDDILLPSSYVVTGVRFRMLGTHMNLEVRMTKMDFEAGMLIELNNTIWIGNDRTVKSQDRRTEIKLDHPHIPTLSQSESLPDSESNQFIRFRESDRAFDASQTTVPFFDAQPVVPVKQTPLGGCGIFHKGQPKFGGFVAPRVHTYDLGQHVQLPWDQVTEEEKSRYLEG